MSIRAGVEFFTLVTLAGIATGIGLGALDYRAGPVAIRERFELVSCRPVAGVCLIFDSEEGRLIFIPLPTGPAPRPEAQPKAGAMRST